MDLEERNNENKGYVLFKSSLDMAMGVLYIIISGYAMKMDFIIERYGKTTVYVIAGLFIFYGGFRMVRGILLFRSMHRKRR